ncbi:MAG: DUF4166 domain-containing protein [Devosia sp.]|nr:DUF4166 domain-containing protein [Devosia sp.]
MQRPHVLIVGASGVFGSRLARLLAHRHAFRISLGGRTEARVATLQRELRSLDEQAEFAFIAIDRETVSADRLREMRCDLVVDCSGPFQLASPRLIEAAIGARCDYVDLADSRAFVSGIARFDAAARGVGVTLLSGASTPPCLTHAVLDHLTSAWLTVDTIDIAIVPGNRTPKGRAVISAILSWVGQRVPVFREAEWQEGWGWGDPVAVSIEGLGRRQARLADVPDLDLLATRFEPRVRAWVGAGMELRLLDGLIAAAGWPVRHRFIRTASGFTGLGYRIAMLLDRFGTDTGGMLVEVAGQDARGVPKVARWTLRARKGHGPYVPVAPAAALIVAMLLGRGMLPGARPAVGVLALDQVRAMFEGLEIDTSLTAFKGEKPLYRRILGEDFDRMPEVTRRLHRGRPAVVATGEALLAPAETRLGRFLARRFGLPVMEGRVPARVVIESRGGREHWTRVFDRTPMRSTMSAAGEGLIEEQFGALAVTMRLVSRPDGLDMVPVSARWHGIPLPKALLPLVKAEERVDAGGRHRFDVEISVPFAGRLVAYRGYLVL